MKVFIGYSTCDNLKNKEAATKNETLVKKKEKGKTNFSQSTCSIQLKNTKNHT